MAGAPAAARRALSLVRGRGSSILTYHGVADLPLSADPHRLMVPAETLFAHVEALREAGFEPVTVAELGRRAAGGSPPPGLVALSFDDGLANLHGPLLELARSGVPTTVYVVSGWIGGAHASVPGRDGEMLGPAQVRELAESGVEIGGHTVTHPDLSALPFDACLTELRESRESLESVAGRPVTTAAYPYGRYSEQSMRAAREAGYEVAAAEANGRGWEPMAMARAPLGRGESWASFVLKAGGRWPAFSQGAPGRLARSAVNRARAVAGGRGRRRRGARSPARARTRRPPDRG